MNGHSLTETGHLTEKNNRKQGQKKSNQNLSGVGLLKSLPLLTSWRQSADLRPSHNNDIVRALPGTQVCYHGIECTRWRLI